MTNYCIVLLWKDINNCERTILRLAKHLWIIRCHHQLHAQTWQLCKWPKTNIGTITCMPSFISMT